jgi:hypothetical protein
MSVVAPCPITIVRGRGDVARIEAVLAEQYGRDVRAQMWTNLAKVCRRSGATERMPMAVRAFMRSASNLR